MSEYYVHPSSVVDEGVTIGEGTRIWHFCHIQKGALIGRHCSLGQNVNVSNNVHIGDGCKLQNNVSVYEGVELEDYVFCGPSCVFTNDLTPRARARPSARMLRSSAATPSGAGRSSARARSWRTMCRTTRGCSAFRRGAAAGRANAASF